MRDRNVAPGAGRQHVARDWIVGLVVEPLAKDVRQHQQFARLGLPAAPTTAPPLFAMPHEYESTSISFWCLSSSDFPLMSPIFEKMSV
jgi:hypothetical protein